LKDELQQRNLLITGLNGDLVRRILRPFRVRKILEKLGSTRRLLQHDYAWSVGLPRLSWVEA
jgi:hypothetical protein